MLATQTARGQRRVQTESLLRGVEVHAAHCRPETEAVQLSAQVAGVADVLRGQPAVQDMSGWVPCTAG